MAPAQRAVGVRTPVVVPRTGGGAVRRLRRRARARRAGSTGIRGDPPTSSIHPGGRPASHTGQHSATVGKRPAPVGARQPLLRGCENALGPLDRFGFRTDRGSGGHTEVPTCVGGGIDRRIVDDAPAATDGHQHDEKQSRSTRTHPRSMTRSPLGGEAHPAPTDSAETAHSETDAVVCGPRRAHRLPAIQHIPRPHYDIEGLIRGACSRNRDLDGARRLRQLRRAPPKRRRAHPAGA